MPSDLLKPLAVLARQPQSQRCIKAIRNLGDAWHRLTDEPLSELDTKLHTRGNQLRPGPKIQNAQEDQSSLSNPITVEMSTREPLTTPNEEPPVSEPSRHYRILADWGTVFIWRDYDNLRGGEGDCMLEAEEILCSPVYPPSVFEHYGAWVDLYTDSFADATRPETSMPPRLPPSRKRWPGMWRGKCWRGALPWRLMLGRIEFSAGVSKYMIEKGNATSVTLVFFAGSG